ncbi:hypothetical protein E2320_014358, partial [Naja naja]
MAATRPAGLEVTRLEEFWRLEEELALLLWAQGTWGKFKNKCLLTLQRDLMGPASYHYRPGELSIGGIISATQAKFRILSFKSSPLTQVLGAGIAILCLVLERMKEPVAGKVLITTMLWDLSLYLIDEGNFFENIHSMVSFVLKSNQMTKYGGYRYVYSFMKHFAEKSFMCFYNKKAFSVKEIWGMLKNKCLLTLQRGVMDPKNHYRPGELSIGGIISATQAHFERLHFQSSPLTQVL